MWAIRSSSLIEKRGGYGGAIKPGRRYPAECGRGARRCLQLSFHPLASSFSPGYMTSSESPLFRGKRKRPKNEL